LAPDDVETRDRLQRLGIDALVADGAPPRGVAAAVVAAVGGKVAAPSDDEPVAPSGPTGAECRLLAVWGPTGAPGRSVVAVNLAAELAALGHPTLCIDLDTYGAALAQLVGLLDDGSGVAAACRAANAGSLDAATLQRLAVEVRPGLRLLTGITGSHRWPELRTASVDVMLDRAREAFRYVVADVGFCVEQDEELSYDTVAPRRNGAAIDVISAANTVVTVAAADPVGIARYVRAVADLPRSRADQRTLTVVNRVRRSVIGRGDPTQQIGVALGRYASVHDAVLIPDDVTVADSATASGRVWCEVAPASPARLAIRELAYRVSGDHPPPHARRRRARLLQVRA
jgi:Flp pilus assembly CpaE family ATPase